MKKHFYSLWFRVVIIFFWAMVTTVLVMGVLLHLMRGTFLWNFFPFTGLGFLAVLLSSVIPLFLLIAVLASVLAATSSEAWAALASLGALVPYYLILYILKDKIRSRLSFKIEHEKP